MTVAAIDALGSIAGATWPVGLTMAVMLVRDRVREGRRRRALNERLHELRRPLQALVLAARPRDAAQPDPLELALAALRDLDREVNGERLASRRRPVEARMLAIAAAERWRVRVAAAGRRIRVRWRCADELANVDPIRIGQALDNLIANALEHGGGEITIEGARRGAQLELAVRDRGARRTRRVREHRDPRRGHGLKVARAAARSGRGRLRVSPGNPGTVAALELPLARRAPAAQSPKRR